MRFWHSIEMKKPTIAFEYICDETVEETGFCATCGVTPVDLSKYTPKEIERILDQPGDLCVKATFRKGQLVTRPAPVSIWIRAATQWSVVALLSCETNPRPRAVTLEAEVELPEVLSEQEQAAVSKLKTEFNLEIQTDESCEPSRRGDGEVVTLGDALTGLEAIQSARNKRHGLKEKEHSLSPLTQDDAMKVWRTQGGHSKTLVEVLEELEPIVKGRRKRPTKGKRKPTGIKVHQMKSD